MTAGTVHVVGAGLAGLSAAVALVQAGRRVVVHESGPAAGGRCRSYFDRELGCRLDNGNHLLLSGNRAAYAFLDTIGARATLGGPGAPVFPFMDVGSGERWTVRPNAGRLPWWVLAPGRRVPGTRLREFAAVLALRRAGPDATLAAVLGSGPLFRRLLEPLAVSALNTRPEEASARLMAAVVAESLSAGGAACVPAFPLEGLSESFIDPAVAWLVARGAAVRLGRRVSALAIEAGRVAGLRAPDGPAALGPADAVVLAVPPPVAAALLPELVVPDRFEAILNVHFRAEADPDALPARAGFVGLVGGTAEWVFAKPGVASVTISAAGRLLDVEPAALAQQVWPEVRSALRLHQPGADGRVMLRDMPKYRVVKEKRATFAATPAQDRRRPPARTALGNLFLAGDWTATGLPATIEGAIRSGRTAADALLSVT